MLTYQHRQFCNECPLLEESMCLNEYFIMGVYAALKSILEQMYKAKPHL